MEGVKKRGFRNITKLVLVLSAIWIISSLWWFGKHWDFSQAFLYVLVGVAGIVFAMVYEWIVRMKMDIQEIDKTVSCMSSYLTTKFPEELK